MNHFQDNTSLLGKLFQTLKFLGIYLEIVEQAFQREDVRLVEEQTPSSFGMNLLQKKAATLFPGWSILPDFNRYVFSPTYLIVLPQKTLQTLLFTLSKPTPILNREVFTLLHEFLHILIHEMKIPFNDLEGEEYLVSTCTSLLAFQYRLKEAQNNPRSFFFLKKNQEQLKRNLILYLEQRYQDKPPQKQMFFQFLNFFMTRILLDNVTNRPSILKLKEDFYVP